MSKQIVIYDLLRIIFRMQQIINEFKFNSSITMICSKTMYTQNYT